MHLHYCGKQPCIFDGFLLIGFVACLLFYEVGLEFLRTSHQSPVTSCESWNPCHTAETMEPQKGWIFQLRNLPLPYFFRLAPPCFGGGCFSNMFTTLGPSHTRKCELNIFRKTRRTTTWCHGSLNISHCKSHKPSSVPHSGCDKTTFIMLDLPDCSVCQSLTGLESGRFAAKL